jgi:hypothetical protein
MSGTSNDASAGGGSNPPRVNGIGHAGGNREPNPPGLPQSDGEPMLSSSADDAELNASLLQRSLTLP